MIAKMTSTNRKPGIVDLFDIPVSFFESYEHALECVSETINSEKKALWIAMNPIKAYNAWHDRDLLALLQKSEVNYCDGVGISIASRVLRGRGIKRCTGCELFFRILEKAAKEQWGVYFLGASRQSNAGARAYILNRYPGLKIAGWHDGYFDDSQAIIADINASQAQLLFVAMGSPKQEFWIDRNREGINAQFCMGVGGSFDVASGNVRRAPRVFQWSGTEFLFRLMCEPRKRWAQQVVLLRFSMLVVRKKLFGST